MLDTGEIRRVLWGAAQVVRCFRTATDQSMQIFRYLKTGTAHISTLWPNHDSSWTQGRRVWSLLYRHWEAVLSTLGVTLLTLVIIFRYAPSLFWFWVPSKPFLGDGGICKTNNMKSQTNFFNTLKKLQLLSVFSFSYWDLRVIESNSPLCVSSGCFQITLEAFPLRGQRLFLSIFI